MPPNKIGQITFVLDERLSREKQSLLARTVNALRPFADLKMESGSITETELLKKLEGAPPGLVLAPWYRYLAWSKVEALYGLTRTSGPTFAGYFCEPVLPYELGETADHLRAILLDFGTSTPAEVALLIKSLMVDTQRAGIKPLLDANAPIYTEAWFASAGQGSRMDTVLALPEIAGNPDWAKRAAAIRICLSALWSLVYEEGPGKSEFQQAITASSPKAYFQLGADRRCLAMRLCYTMPMWGPKEALAAFWPQVDRPSSAPQLLRRHADLVRVHRIPENNDIEVTIGFFATAGAERAPESIHTLWVEPLSASVVLEVPFQAPGAEGSSVQLRPLPGAPSNEISLNQGKARELERNASETAQKIQELKREIAARDNLIRELRTGGVGTAMPIPPPDAESLLEAFQEKYFEAKYQIRQFELQILDLEERKGSRMEIDALRNRMDILLAREQGWVQRLTAALEIYRESARAKKAKLGGG